MAEIIQSITDLPIDEIEIGDRLRPVGRAGVEAIKASYAELGVIKDKIHVRRLKGGKTRLIAGGHRLVAQRELRDEGHAELERVGVVAWRCNDDFARLMEIDDNLAGAELTALDTAVFLAARKEVYEKAHPETRASAGAVLAAKRWNATDMMSVASFAASAAEKMGCSEKHVRRLVMAGKAVQGHAHRLRNAPKPVSLSDLMQISKINNPPERYAVVEALATGTAKNAATARKAFKAGRGEGPGRGHPAHRRREGGQAAAFARRSARVRDGTARTTAAARRAASAQAERRAEDPHRAGDLGATGRLPPRVRARRGQRRDPDPGRD
ncbi:chromosome partitioning protein ParB [Citreimonas sp.]|uniref:chromosome partitioning protein ParB n=1 Tax=Citreimonas sp. TaxID=3036715 RepID=UPI0035C84BBD